MSDNKNRKAAIIALIAVVVLSLVAVVLIVHLLRDVDFSSIKMPVLPWSESTAASTCSVAKTIFHAGDLLRTGSASPVNARSFIRL